MFATVLQVVSAECAVTVAENPCALLIWLPIERQRPTLSTIGKTRSTTLPLRFLYFVATPA
jgi:hypothetical protein